MRSDTMLFRSGMEVKRPMRSCGVNCASVKLWHDSASETHLLLCVNTILCRTGPSKQGQTHLVQLVQPIQSLLWRRIASGEDALDKRTIVQSIVTEHIVQLA